VLGHSSCEDETVEIITAVIQMYREQGYYLERIYKWAKRVGYDEVRSQIMEDKIQRSAYYQRFVESQKVAQVDPWSERVSGMHKNEFAPIVPVEIEAGNSVVQPLLRTV